MNQHLQPTATSLLTALRDGDPYALGRLFDVVYQELRGLAQVQRRRWPKSDTLNTTALVHEAFIKLDVCHSRKSNARW
jgi:hypothetical protein